MDVTKARAFLAERRRQAEELRHRRAGEFETTRPTPSQEECDLMAQGTMTMLKVWDLSPVDPFSFDPTEPPGRPAT